MKRPASEEGYELTLGVTDEPVAQVAPEADAATPAEWIRKNLFRGPGNSIITIVTAAFVVWLGIKVIGFVFGADWSVLKANLRVYMTGRFPVEELWRVWVDIYAVALLVGLTRGVMAGSPWTARRIVRWVVLGALATALIPWLVEGSTVPLLFLGAAGLAGVGALIGRAAGRRLRVPLRVGWILIFPFIVVILRGFGGVKPEEWGGLLLNVIVAVVAIFVSFPLGLLLALGRRSTLPAVRAFSVGFIEFVRGVPLVALLIFGVFAFELLLPPGIRLPNIVLAMAMFVIFSSAYVAEIVRGGLQGVPEGQYEASRALGLRYPRMMGLIVLPQALRNTIPAMISHFISLFKDTSLLAAVGLFSDLLSVASRATRNPDFVGLEAEALVPAAFIFWAIAYSMAKWSQRVERRVGVGER
jgi:general L-amino acid transport system permease protein